MGKSLTYLLIGLGALLLVKQARRSFSGLGELEASRPSCMFCVKKHLGSAAVIADEVLHGWPQNEVYMIGHLHEAASESQQYPELCDAVRKARLEFQEQGKMPNFEKLYQMACSCS